ncbi:hypothetical protein C1H46_031608 [Malus baccata]|uniref:Uncharacterized protein n=1 Tax=Malus baccata TaxID=106549 RepID=A0A540L8U7_MALBA|nr:hypothetical protein C1H46_031608 [Malus baccata]
MDLVKITIKKCVVVDGDDVLQLWVKKHHNASCKPNKPFPLYPRLCTVFRRDRATGSMAKSVADAIENMGLENEDCDETSEMPPTSLPHLLLLNLGEIFTFGEAKARLPSELQAMGLPYDHVLKISMKLVKDIDLMRIWYTLDDSHKANFIKMFMDGL